MHVDVIMIQPLLALLFGILVLILPRRYRNFPWVGGVEIPGSSVSCIVNVGVARRVFGMSSVPTLELFR